LTKSWSYQYSRWSGGSGRGGPGRARGAAMMVVVVFGTNWTSERNLKERQTWKATMKVKMFIFVDILMLILDFIFKKGMKMKMNRK
jgi:hypothetical protein